MNTVLTERSVTPEFSLKTFYPLIEKLAKRFPDMERTDWKDIIRNKFALTPEQELSLENVSETASAKIQQSFKSIAAHVNKGGAITGKIIVNDDRSHTVCIFQETVKFTGGSMFRMFQIAHCDSDCRNWGWG